MTSFAIVMGFAVMVFLPCAFALMSSRNSKETEASAYGDRLVESGVKPRMTATVRAQAKAMAAAAMARQAARRGDWGEVGDPPAPGRSVHHLPEPRVAQPQYVSRQDRVTYEAPQISRQEQWFAPESRVERAELEAMRARAVAIRAHAEALAAMARAAEAKAAFAAVQAAVAEDQAAHALQETRRAA